MLCKSERESLCWALHSFYPLAVVKEIYFFFNLTGQSFYYTSDVSKLFRRVLRIPADVFPEGSHALPQSPSPGPANAVRHPGPCCAGR